MIYVENSLKISTTYSLSGTYVLSGGPGGFGPKPNLIVICNSCYPNELHITIRLGSGPKKKHI